MNYIINSPLEQFEIQTYISIYNDNLDISWLSITSISVYNIIVLSIILLLHILILSRRSIVPTKWQVSIEAIYFTVYSMVYGQLGEKGTRYIPLIYSLFIYILISNIISIVPYNFAILAHIVYTIALSVTVWLGVTLLGFFIHRISYLNLFVPSGCSLALAPVLVIIELISYFARALSLGLRLGANILAGHILLVILSGLIFDFMSSSVLFFIIGFLPLFLVVGIMGLEIAISIIQAYVFCVLTSSYIKDALYIH
jgi:F-type H+-transporting ATPase subunit a